MSSQQSEPTCEEIRQTKVYKDWAMSEEEYEHACKILHRLPNYTECGLFAVMWSEHCSYKNTKPVLRSFPTKGPRVIQGPGEGAGVVDIGDGLAVVFKAESHNHPSAVEPYEGAATGVGGILRDIFSMGARPIAVLDSLRFSALDHPRTEYLFKEIIHGISGYGNCIGIPTVGGEIAFDESYQGNPLVNVMCVGLMETRDLKLGRAAGAGNSIIYVGAKTGRDGIHGATFASEEFDTTKQSKRSAVQVGDPFMEKLLLEACLDIIKTCPEELVGIQDMGAAGLVSSSSEMASKAHMGMELNLDLVPQREAHMTPYEMMLSESQERMLLCVKKGHEDKIIQICEKYSLDAVKIGEVCEGHQYKLYHKGKLVADIPVDALSEDAPVYENESREPARIKDAEPAQYEPRKRPGLETLKMLLATPTIASKRSVYETYDTMVRTSTVVGPGSSAAVIRVRGTRRALAATTDCNARYIYLDPFVGGQIAVCEAARNVVASGALPLAITDCLNFGNPKDPEIFYEIKESARGISSACEALKTPVVSGNVSLNNETNGKAIMPTPMIGMVGLVEDIDHITRAAFSQAGDYIYVLGDTHADFNGSELQQLECGEVRGKLFDFDLQTEVRNQKIMLEAIRAGFISACTDVSEGGLAVALCECAFAHDLGFDISVDMPTPLVFAETQARFVFSVPSALKASFEETYGPHVTCIGRVTEEASLHLHTQDEDIHATISELKQGWEQTISRHM